MEQALTLSPLQLRQLLFKRGSVEALFPVEDAQSHWAPSLDFTETEIQLNVELGEREHDDPDSPYELRTGRRLERSGDVPVTLELTKIVRCTQRALRIATRGESLLERRADVCSGAQVFKGTRVPLVQVVEQFRAGVPFAQIAEDYPHIKVNALRYAQLRARIGQPPGRPVRPLELRRTAIEAAD